MVCEIDNIMPNIPNTFPHLVMMHTIVLFCLQYMNQTLSNVI